MSVSVVITACNRPSLLQTTLESFFQYNTYPVDKIIIVEDSGNPEVNHLVKAEFAHKNILWLDNKHNLGQAASIDKAYAQVTTKYVFHCEEDWQFYRHGFIEDSLTILQKNKRIMQVWIRADDDTNGHPLEDETHAADDVNYRLLQLNYNGIWHGFSFNPGLRRMADYKRMGPYKRYGQNNTLHGSTVEARLSQAHRNAGYRAAAICGAGYVKHIGWGHHVARNLQEQPQRPCFIIPYRDREAHLRRFLPTLHKFLQHKGLTTYGVLVVEQHGTGPFNRAKLLNVGATLAANDYDYFVFHDVDMLPVTADYRYSTNPCHIATQCSQFNYKMPYDTYFGGVTIFDKKVFWQINGYSNNFWGWGAEDDENLLRVQAEGMVVERRQCRFLCAGHTRDYTLLDQNKQLLTQAQQNPTSYKTDGLNSLQYQVLATETVDEHTRKVTVQI